MRDGTSLLNKLFPDTPAHTKQHRVKQGYNGRDNLLAYASGEGGSTAHTSEDVPTRWAAICTLEMRGLTHKAIAEAVGMASQSVTNIVNDERYIEYRERRLAVLDHEFVAMKPLAFAALKGALTSADENTALRASETWFKGAGFGGYSKREQQQTTLSAEDIAAALLRNASSPLVQVNTQVNVTTDTAGAVIDTTPAED